MTVHLNHTLVASLDKWASARFLASILELDRPAAWGPFVQVPVGNEVSLDFMDAEEIHANHYAFLVDDTTFDDALARLRAFGVSYTADPYGNHPDEINHLYGGRGLYFDDPSGHQLEIMTAPYGDPQEFRDTM
jgi:catechol 2,3-dioxygenase-like lactoylglutathione lyase family enzyme